MAAELEQGRESYRRRQWGEAHRLLSLADEASPLVGEDLERLAVSAYLVGRDDDYLTALERAYRSHLGKGDGRRAVRCAFWLALRLLFRGETGRATGWLARARRGLDAVRAMCVEEGYLLLPAFEQHLAAGDLEAAHAAAVRAVEIGDRFAEADLSACARHLQGRALLRQGRIDGGLALLDEAMLAVSAGELSPIMTGLVYCSVIDSCREVYALGRAREWTSALAAWCAEQPEMLSFTGICSVHRAEILQLDGAWGDALEEARRACERSVRADNPKSAGAALCQEADLHRLRGEFDAAEEAYRRASRAGWDPQPGLALLRLAQGRVAAAEKAILRAVSAAAEGLERSRLLPACVEILLAAGDVDGARRAAGELESTAGSLDTPVLRAMAAHARGAVEIADSDPRTALGFLRLAFETWQEIGAPYEAARVRVLAGRACRMLGDGEGAKLELDAARAAFRELGAAPDLARLEAVAAESHRRSAHGLTPRELEVLRLVATGQTNRAIAERLSVSRRTVDRHVSNIFAKIDVSSRAAATAYAYEHGLL